MLKKNLFFALFLIIASCQGTGSSYDPIVDGVKDQAYYNTLAYCQQLSQQRGYMNADTKTSAVAGAGAGAIFGAILGGDLAGAAVGSAVGSGIGAGSQAMQTKEEKKYIIVRCLRSRGYNVIM